MIDLSFLPAVNAALNGVTGVLLVAGLMLIRQHRITAHRNVMIAAFSVSGLFLVTYVTHYVWRATVVGGTHTRYHGEGLLAGLYYGMLLSHILLAIFVPVLAVTLIYLGLTKRYATHRRLARVAWPVWMYVSVTGVLIYFMLYHFNPGA
ncbi:MAG: DUF420 domain-containing protein [Phycisphaeraceae bacterium]